MSKLRLFLPLIVIACIGCMFAGCDSDDDVWDEYEDWRVANEKYFEEQRFLIENGTNVYRTFAGVEHLGQSAHPLSQRP